MDEPRRDPAPPYQGEGGFALWHFSEDPALSRFEPRPAVADPQSRRLVWAVDTRHAPMFWFPRDCPRGCVWPGSATTEADLDRFFGQTAASRIHVIESGWHEAVLTCCLYAYRLPSETFAPHQVGGYWTSTEPVDAVDRVVVDDLIGRHARAGIELRITPSIWPFWQQVTASTLHYSGSRLKNAVPPTARPRDDVGDGIVSP